MNIQGLKKELEDVKIFQDLSDVLKSISGVRYPRLKNYSLSLKKQYKENRNHLYFTLKRINPYSLSFDEKFDNDCINYGDIINHNIVKLLKNEKSRYFFSAEKNKEEKKILLVVLAPNKGYCGNYIREFNKYLLEKLNYWDEKGYKLELLLIGKKLSALQDIRIKSVLPENKIKFPEGLSSRDNKEEFYQEVDKLIEKITDLYINNSYSKVLFSYRRISNLKEDLDKPFAFNNSITQLFPIREYFVKVSDYFGREELFYNTQLFPSAEVALSVLISQYIKLAVRHFFIEAELGENYSRLKAMSTASENIKNEIFRIERELRKARQSKITKQLIEVMATAMSLVEEEE